MKAVFVRPYIAKIDRETMSVVDILELHPQGRDRKRRIPTLNYFGNILVHENGMLYAVGTSTLYEVDPITM